MKTALFLVQFLTCFFTCSRPHDDSGWQKSGVKDLSGDSVKIACYTWMMRSSTLDSMHFAGHTYILPTNDSVTLPAHVYDSTSTIYSTLVMNNADDSLYYLADFFTYHRPGGGAVSFDYWKDRGMPTNQSRWRWHVIATDVYRGHASPPGKVIFWKTVFYSDSVLRIEFAYTNPFYLPPYVPLP